MKNRLPIIIALGILLLGGAGYILLNNQNKTETSTSNLTPKTNTPTPQSEQTVAEAISGKGSVKCEFTTEDGYTTVAYVKNGQVRSDLSGAGEGNMSFLYKDSTAWSWDRDTKKGFKYNVEKMEMPSGTKAQESVKDEKVPDQNKMKEQIETYKDSCKNEPIPDSMFSVPKDVEFQDYSAMINTQMKDVMKEVPKEYQKYLDQ